MITIENNYNSNKNNNTFLHSNNIEAKNYRDKLLKNFSLNNLDKKNNESLKNVNISKFLEFNYKYNLPEDPSLTKVNNDGSYTIVIVNGQCQNYSDNKIEISNLSKENINFYLNNNINESNDIFINLNSLFLNSGYKIKIKKNNNIKIKISNIISEDELTIFQKNILICEEGASVDLVEEYENENNAIYNVVYNIIIEKDSLFNHFILQDNTSNHNLILTSHSECYEKSFYRQRVYNFSDGYVRNFHYSDLKEISSEVDLQGFFFLKGLNTANNKTFISHLAENCKSNQVYKGILNDKAKATYFSNTHVDQVAQKTEGYQLSKGILLSNDCSYFSKPELKIYADDVKCSHGSTIGPIDENAIFYLRSRGMSKNSATKMLISSFINEDLNSIKDEQIAEIVQKKLIRYLSQIK